MCLKRFEVDIRFFPNVDPKKSRIFAVVRQVVIENEFKQLFRHVSRVASGECFKVEAAGTYHGLSFQKSAHFLDRIAAHCELTTD